MRKVLDIIKRHSVEAVVIGALLLAGLLSLIFTSVFAKDGTTVRVSVDGELYGEYSLYFDSEYRINDTNILVISGGVAYMRYADCPDKTCINMGKISKVGEKIICLPNRVAAEIK